MGTTLTAMLRDGNRIGLLHVGDSRAYLLREGIWNGSRAITLWSRA